MHDHDCLHRFSFEHYPICGHIVHLDASWRALIEHREYPVAIRDALGEAVAASALLAATLKFDGTVSLQLRGQGPMYLMLVQCSSDLGIRAVARYREAQEQGGLLALSGAGNLTVMLENDDLSQRYQGIVPLESDHLATCLQGYVESLKRLPTRLWLHADEHSISGMLLQRVSDDSVVGRARTLAAAEDIDDAWRRAQLMADTLSPIELCALSDKQILRRAFAEDDVRMFKSRPVFFRCRCSRKSVMDRLKSLGAGEIRSMLAKHDGIEVQCDFCNRAYRYDAVDVEHMLSAGSHGERSGTTH